MCGATGGKMFLGSAIPTVGKILTREKKNRKNLHKKTEKLKNELEDR
jgi:hypothetical protein